MRCTKLFILLLVFASCKKQELPLYQGEHALYLVKNWRENPAYSFVQHGSLAITDATLMIPVVMVGGLQALDIPINYRIEIETDNPALIGKTGSGNTIQQQMHFDGTKKSDTLRLHLVRIPALADTSLLVRVKLVAPEPYDTEIVGASEAGLFRELDIVIDDIYSIPGNWEDFEDYLGPFSSKKMRIICQESMYDRLTWIEIQTALGDVVRSGRQGDMGTLLYNYLEEQRRLGKPVLERNGEEMKAGPLMYE